MTALAIYRVHLGSWMRVPEEANRRLTYRELAPRLLDHARRVGFTHVELDPDGYAADPRPLIDELHKGGLAVILDDTGPLSADGNRVRDEIAVGGVVYRIDTAWTARLLGYLGRDPIERKHHHAELLQVPGARSVLALDRDARSSVVARLHGDRWQQFATLRLLLAFQYALPGGKLVGMGTEFGQWAAWNPQGSLDWHVLDDPVHRGVQLLTGTLNQLYRSLPALGGDAFEWLFDDADQSVLAFERDNLIAAFNFTPVPRHNVRLGVPAAGFYTELLNTDATAFGGAAQGNLGGVESTPVRAQHRELSIAITVPPLGAVWLAR